MKGIISVLISMVLFLVISGATHAEDQGGEQQVLKELGDFQKALSGWMKNVDGLVSQFSTLQKSVGDSLSPLKEFEKTIKGNEGKLNSIVSRLEGIEKSTSVGEVRLMLDSFGKTLDVIKKLLSDLTKRVEDQEVKTAVLEKRYQEAQRPLDPIKKAIEDLNKIVKDKLGEQEKRIATVEDSFKTRVASLDSAAKIFEGQSKAVSDMEMRMEKLEKGGIGVAKTEIASVPPSSIAKMSEGTETVTVAEGTGTAVTATEHIPTPEEEGFKEIGDGFYMRNVNLLLFGSSSQIKGEIKNLSDRDRSIATFMIKVYNVSNMLVFTQDFSIKTFKRDEIRSFSEIISGYAPIEIARYEVLTKRRY
ncbi:MAG: hypothetical protein HS132_09185 [Planctomycetia bacterium]|nr:hypothetical protein [Planctomycetia bacterium]